MSSSLMLRAAVERFGTDNNAQALDRLWFRSVDEDSIHEELGQIGMFVQPAYLPLAYSSQQVIALYVRPGRELEQCPVVLLDRDLKNVRIAADTFLAVRAALLLVAGRWLKDWDEALSAVKQFAENEPAVRPVSAQLSRAVRGRDASTVGLWSSNVSEPVQEIWSSAELGHPFAEAPAIDYIEEPLAAV